MPAIRPLDLPKPPEVNKEIIEYIRLLLKRLHTDECDWLKIEGILINKKGESDWVDHIFPDY